MGVLVKELAASDLASLGAKLDTANQTSIALQRHAAYLKVQTLENNQNQEVKAAQASVETDESILEAAMSSRLRQVPRAQIASLGRYAYLAQEAQQDASHALSPDVELYRGVVTHTSEDDIANAYDQLIGTLGNSQGISSPNVSTRRAAMAKRDAAYDDAAPVAASLLANLINLENRDSVAQGYANAADRKYASLGLSPQLIQKTLAEVQAEAPAYRNYEQVVAEHAAQKLGLPSILSSEQNLADAPAPKISFAQGRQLILDSFQPLGQDYIRRFAQLLDPRNGRLDLSGGAHRAHTGTSIATYDAPVAFYFEGYNGSLDSVRVIAHEGGHAIHRELMNASGIPVYERTGPHYLFEGYALFNELLLFDHAGVMAKTPVEREHALKSFIGRLSVDLFITAEEAGFERSLYTEASGQPLLDRAKIDSIYRDAIAPYEYWPMSDVGTSRAWMRKSLLFQDPLYLVNYLYASLVAVALYERSHTDPQFSSKYEALLSRGFDADPQVLLASMNIRLDDPALVKAASRLLQAKTGELQHLYQEESLPAK